MKIIINTYKKMKTIILILLALTLMSCSTGRFFTKYQMTDNNKKTYYVDTFQIENDSIKFDEVIYRLHKLVPYKFELKKIIITKSK